jgi:hypothetical protein
MLISRKRSDGNIDIYLSNRKMELVKEMKYLGIYFDRRLTFDRHNENIAEKSTTLIYRFIQNDFRGFNNLSYTIHLR